MARAIENTVRKNRMRAQALEEVVEELESLRNCYIDKDTGEIKDLWNDTDYCLIIGDIIDDIENELDI